MVLSAGLLALPPGAAAQADGRPASWEIGVHAGALRVDEDFSIHYAGSTGTVVGATATWRPASRVFLEVDAWRHVGEGNPRTSPVGPAPPDLDLRGAGLALGVAPLAGRGAAEPHLLFGVETVRAGDDEERSVAFVSGGGIGFRIGGRAVLRFDVRNHFLTIDEGEVDGVDTGRDASLWEIRMRLGLAFGGSP